MTHFQYTGEIRLEVHLAPTTLESDCYEELFCCNGILDTYTATTVSEGYYENSDGGSGYGYGVMSFSNDEAPRSCWRYGNLGVQATSGPGPHPGQGSFYAYTGSGCSGPDTFSGEVPAGSENGTSASFCMNVEFLPYRFGESWDGRSLQQVLDGEYGAGVIDAFGDYLGSGPEDADPIYWDNLGANRLYVREITGSALTNSLGWYEETLTGTPTIDGVDDGLIFSSPISSGSVFSVNLPPQSTRFGFYLNPQGDSGSCNAPEPELFFTNRFYNDPGPNGYAYPPATSDSDVQCLVFDISHLRRGEPTFVLAWEDRDAGGRLLSTEAECGTDNDYTDLIVEISTVPPAKFDLTDIPAVGASRAAAWIVDGSTMTPALYLTRRSVPNVLLQVSPSVKVVDITPPILAHSGDGVATLWCDIATDGVLDPYILNIDEPNVLLFNNAATDEFIDITTQILSDDAGSRTAEAFDHNNDGVLDLFLTRTGNLSDVLLEYGRAGFTDVTPPALATLSSTTGSSTADYDNDGDLDLYVVRWNAPNTIVRNDGAGSWIDASPPGLADSGKGTSAAWGDFDNDGLLDLALTNWSGPNKIYRNDGERGFTDITPAAVEADSSNGNAAWVDYDNDGWVDLFYTRGSGTGMDRLWRNTGFGFEEVVTPILSVSGNHAGAAWADVDEDGDMDVFQAEFEVDAPSRLLLNQLDNGNSWVEVDLAGAQSNRLGIGARIRVVAGGKSQIRDVVCSAGNKSQNMIRAHFGLGAVSSIDSMIIRWPSGVQDVGVNVPVNQVLTASEGGSVTQAPKAVEGSSLGNPVPNPFNPRTIISYSVGAAGDAELVVYDLAGRRVKTLVSGHVEAGEHWAQWDGRDDQNRRVASGVYLYRLTAGAFSETKRMALLK